MIMWIEYGTGIRGMASTRETEMLTYGLSDNFAASIQNSCDDCCIKLRYISLEYRRAIHHRDTCNADIVFDCNTFTCQNSGWCAFDRALLIPGVQRIFRSIGAIAASARIAHCQSRFSELVDPPIGL